MLSRKSLRIFTFIIFIFFAFTAHATNYYFSNAGSDANIGTNSSSPWQTLNKLNSFKNLNPGDSVLFKRGDSFYGSIIVNYTSSSIENPIVYSAYSMGEKPIITGFTTVSAWTNFGKNIYYASLDVNTLNAVTVNGIIEKMGRYPNSGYLHYQTHTNNTSITSTDLNGSPDWTGAEVVIRKYRWILDRHKVIAQKGGNLTYDALADYGNNNSYDPVDGNGFFIQNSISTLDSSGEWFNDKVNKRLYMYFGDGIPSSNIVKASSIDKVILLNSSKNITFNNLDIQGSNILGVEMQGVSNITFKDCDFKQQGGTAIYANGAINLNIIGGIMEDVLNNGIWVEQNGSFCTIDGVTISNIGTFAGAGRSGDAAQEGISINGDNTTIKNCSVSNIGYNGINFNGDNALVENNFIDSFCTIKDDGGGIYTYLGSLETKSNRIIKNNIIINAIGAFSGVESYSYEAFGKAAGIYLDGYSNHVEIIGNTIAHGNWGGIFINNNSNNQIRNNNVYDFSEQILFTSIGSVSNTIVYGNAFVAKTASQKTLGFNFYSNDNPGLSGSFDNNIYARPINENSSILLYRWYSGGGGPSNITLATWKLVYNQDLNSTTSPKVITDLNDLRFEYNASLKPKNVNLDANYIDVTGKTYNGTITLAPYSSAVLIKNGSITNQPPIANAGAAQSITLPVNSVNFSGSGTDADGTIVSYLWTKISGSSAGTITNSNAAATSVIGLIQGIYQFELRVTDNNGAVGKDTMQVIVNPAANIPPVAKAGSAQTITLPINYVSLSGSGTDADGTIVSLLWTKILGSSAGTITNSNAAVTVVTGLIQGVYQFELKVTDNSGAIAKDTMQVIVNLAANVPPVANAGGNKSIQLPVNKIKLTGCGTDADGTIVSYFWTKISGPGSFGIINAASAVTDVSGLVQGTYQFELKVTDNSGAVAKDTMQVIVNPAANIPPIANAGGNKSIQLPVNKITLTGSGTDADGTIVSYVWTKIVGPAAFSILNSSSPVTDVNGLVQGSYQFELKITDNIGAVAKDTMQLIVNPAANIPPVAKAGSAQTITLPVNYVNLSGSGTDADGTVVSYLWTKISGPSAGTISNINVAATSVTVLIQGIYKFELKVTDNSGANGKDTIVITVNPAANIPPIANAGGNKSIQLPVNKITLSGSGTDADGTIVSYVWNKISGPAAYSIVNSSSPVTDVNGLFQGTYQFELKITDNSGAVAKDTMQLIVNPAANIPPVAKAGSAQTITLPINYVNLSGSGTDADGTVVSFLWTKISGPLGGMITNVNNAASSITGLIQGSFQFELQVTDNNGAIGKDTVNVIVNPAVNIPPVSKAGDNKSITLPVNQTALEGKGTDVDGTVVSYLWTKISGPISFNIVNAGSPVTDVTGLIQGTYEFELKVMDNNGAVGKDTMQVFVNKAANIPPVANAGMDITVIFPVNSVILNGSGTDPDGFVVSYLWKQISGPSESVINPNAASASISNLMGGNYIFELTVTDNEGPTGKDTMIVSVDLGRMSSVVNSITVYPNPVKDIAILEINTIKPKGNDLWIVISDIKGKLVYTETKKIDQTKITEKINMSGFAKGVYIIAVYFDKKEKQTLKVVKL